MRLRRLSIIICILLLTGAAALAGVYSQGNATPIAIGQLLQVWTAEAPTPGNGNAAASLAVQMAASATGASFYAHGFFSAAPGAFEVDVQVSPDDIDTHYQTIANGAVTTVDAVNQTFHMDATLASARYARLLLRSRTNAVNLTAWIGR